MFWKIKSENRSSTQTIATDKPNIPLLTASGCNGPFFSPSFSKFYGYYTPQGSSSTISSGGTYNAYTLQKYLFCPPSTSGVTEISNQKVVTLYEAIQGTDGPYWHVGKGSSGYTIQCKPYGFIERWAEYSKGTTAEKVSASESGAKPNDGQSGDYWYTYQGSDSIDPTALTYSKSNPKQSETLTASVTPVGNTYGGTVYYQYQYSTNGGSSWTNTGSKTTATSISVTVPANAAQFQVRVLASDDMGFTSTTYVYGENLTVTPGNRAPAAPVSVTAKETSPQTFTVTWTASTDPDGNLAGYQVERSYDGTTWSSVTISVLGTSITDTVNEGSSAVVYRVRAFDTEGLYSSWTTSAASTVNRPPMAPSSVTAVESSPQDFAVSWTASTDPDGNLAGYQVERSCNNGSSWTTVTNSTSNTSLTDKVTAGNTSVIYRVRAFDSDGLYSDWTQSGASSVSNAPATPATITLPSLINVGENFTVTWAVSNDPDGNLFGYQVERSFNWGTTWESVGDTLTQTSFADVAAEGNKTVMYRVRAIDESGLTSAWKTSAASTINTAPSAPESVTLPEVINLGRSFTIRWPAAADAEDNVTSYEVERSYDDGASWNRVSAVTGTSLTTTEDTPGAVRYRVRAVDAGRLYSGWTASQNTPVNQPPNPPPEIIVGTVRLGEYSTIVWTAATDPDGTIAGYTLQRSVDGGSYETVYSGPGLTYTDKSDNRSWDHVQYRVRATDNQDGISEWTISPVRQVEPGRLYLSGPDEDLGRVIRSFDFAVTVQASGEFPVDGILVVIELDGKEMLRKTVSSGEAASILVDLWVTESSEHTITVTASKDRYTQALGTYRFFVVPIELGEGGRLERLENRNGQAVYPVTLMEGIFRRRDGKSLEEILDSLGDGEGGGGGVSDHRKLTHRDEKDQHPIDAITGLAEQLKRIPEPMSKEDLDEILKFDVQSMYPQFYVNPETGSLYMVTEEQYVGPQFRLVNGNLEVVYGGE